MPQLHVPQLQCLSVPKLPTPSAVAPRAISPDSISALPISSVPQLHLYIDLTQKKKTLTGPAVTLFANGDTEIYCSCDVKLL